MTKLCELINQVYISFAHHHPETREFQILIKNRTKSPFISNKDRNGCSISNFDCGILYEYFFGSSMKNKVRFIHAH